MKIIKTVLIGTVIVFGFIIFGSFVADTSDKKVSTDVKTVKKEPIKGREIDPELQLKRMEFIKKLGSEGYFETIQIENGVGKLWVTNKFLLLSEKDMNTFLEVPYAYVMDELKTDIYTTSFVLKIDNGTQLGKRIGQYNPINGVKFYKFEQV